MNNRFTRCLVSSRDAFNRDCRLTTIFSSRMHVATKGRVLKNVQRDSIEKFERNSQVKSSDRLHPAFRDLQKVPVLFFYFALWKVDSTGQWRPSSFCVDAFSAQHCSSLYSPPGTFSSGFSSRYATIVLCRTGVHDRYIASFVFSFDMSTLLASNTFTDIYDSSIQLFCLDFK